MRAFLFFLYCNFFALYGQSQESAAVQWADSVFNTMSADQKLGQLFSIRAYSKKGNADVKDVLQQIDKYHLGGICFFQGSPSQQALLTNRYQLKSKIPMLIAIDGEWGLGMRFPEDAISFPRQLMLGAIQDNNLIYNLGREIGRECKRIGVQVNFAPVVDVNNNPNNPVINDRSFGEDKYNVAAKGYAYMKGMQDEGVMACAKHFPGHGDTDVDSHLALPVIKHDISRLEDIELMPFKSLIDQKVGSIMVAHLHIPSIDSRPNRPTTLSRTAITKMLREEMNFGGLIFTDAMDMKGVTDQFEAGEAEAEALLAGNDFILLSTDVGKAIEAIKRYLKEGKITQKQIDQSVKRILRSKYDYGLNITPQVRDLGGIAPYINRPEAIALKAQLIEEALTLVRNDKQIIPFKNLNDKKYISIAIGASKTTPFQNRLSSYTQFEHLQIPKEPSASVKSNILSKIGKTDHVVISLHDMSKYASKDFGISQTALDLIRKIKSQNEITLVIFGSPYSLKYFDDIQTILMAYNEDEMTQDLSAQAIFGANAIKGKLPVSAGMKYTFGMGINTASIQRLGYSVPERVGLLSDSLLAIDTIMQEMIDKRAAPGGQVLIAKNGKIVWQKSYGYFTYDKKHKVKNDDIYDVASVTKILASTISVMKLKDEGKMSINAPIKRYIPQADTCVTGDIVIEDILAHHGRLKGWIPFYTQTVSETARNPEPLSNYYSAKLSSGFSIPVANHLFLRSDYKDSIYSRIFACDLRETSDYRYSDLGFYMMHLTIKNLSGQALDEYARNKFYSPLGLQRTDFNPLSRFDILNIAPTEEDDYFRKQRIQGTVHDMGAAMLGGVSGHAGLFSSSQDLAILMQMLLNKGSYGGTQYLRSETVTEFTTRYYKSTRRGLGFDMKELDNDKSMNMSELASENTFGHLGFTGTAVFADPDNDIVFIFLANRTYPTMKNNTFGRENYRPRVQSVIYRSMATKPIRNNINFN